MADTSLRKLRATVIGSIVGFVLGALALLIALAWNSAFQDLFERNDALRNAGPWVYAIAVTAFGVGLGLALIALRERTVPEHTVTFQTLAKS